ncbi:MAG TPA: hypothetical protein VFQ22_13205 [Longimicrobiales bacterium]|nr:hypothetical protein [Longimicrobiales bacterium]
MNLRIGDPSGLIAFLHRAVSTLPDTVLVTPSRTVVRSEVGFFYHAADPVEVGGPFGSLAELVRSEGVRRWPGGASAETPFEIFEWAGRFFRVEREGEAVEPFASLEEARGG